MWLLPAQFGVYVVWFNSQKKIPLIRQQECCPARSAPGAPLMSPVVSGGGGGGVRTPFQACCRLEMLPWPPSLHAFAVGQSPGDPLPAGTCTCVEPPLVPPRVPNRQSWSPCGIKGGASAPPTRCWEASRVCLGSARCGVLDLPLQRCPWAQAPGHRAAVSVSCPWGSISGCWCLSETHSMDEDAPGTWAVTATYQHPDDL